MICVVAAETVYMSASDECPAGVVKASRPVPRCEEDFADMFKDEDVLLSEAMVNHAARHRLVAGLETDDLSDDLWQHYLDLHSGPDGKFVQVKSCPGHVINARSDVLPLLAIFFKGSHM